MCMNFHVNFQIYIIIRLSHVMRGTHQANAYCWKYLANGQRRQRTAAAGSGQRGGGALALRDSSRALLVINNTYNHIYIHDSTGRVA